MFFDDALLTTSNAVASVRHRMRRLATSPDVSWTGLTYDQLATALLASLPTGLTKDNLQITADQTSGQVTVKVIGLSDASTNSTGAAIKPTDIISSVGNSTFTQTLSTQMAIAAPNATITALGTVVAPENVTGVEVPQPSPPPSQPPTPPPLAPPAPPPPSSPPSEAQRQKNEALAYGLGQLQTNMSGMIAELFMLDGEYTFKTLIPLLNFTKASTCAEVRLTGDGRPGYPTIFKALPINVYPSAPRVVLRRIVFELYTATPVIWVSASSGVPTCALCNTDQS